jgi:hypothetical protein
MTSPVNSRRRRLTLAVVALPLGLSLAACGGGANGSTTASAKSAPAVAFDSAGGQADGVTDQPAALRTKLSTRSVISTGTIQLSSKKVAQVRDLVASVLVEHQGFLADERTSVDKRGRTSYARLVLRVPSADFGKAMDEISGFGKLEDSQRTSQDVTTEVIDTDQRVRAQRIGLRRVETLLKRAGSLSNLLRIEDEITRRRADLHSLEQQQAYLRSQTSLATITVTIDRVPPKPVAAGSGFGSGLDKGWHAFTSFLTWTMAALGALLPFTLLLVVLGPLFWWARRVARHRRVAVVEPAQTS